MIREINDEVLNEKYGVSLNGDFTVFKVWSPKAKFITLCIYKNHNDTRRREKKMIKGKNDIWSFKFNSNLYGQYYTYLIDDRYEIVDPFVHSTNANSSKGMIIDAKKVNPDGFLNHKTPENIKFTESIIYELHIKDFSMDSDVDFKYPGKYLGFTERGLKDRNEKIGIDHLVELGITHVHLLPVYDFLTVNDYDLEDYNWGYDPYLYNALEGSYSTNPDNGESRILEFKELVKSLHQAGIRVVLDVVYNHTYEGKTSNFYRLSGNVFYRHDEFGKLSNGSGCGNELDTEHPFVRKFILESLKFWLKTYKIDGFRFDLMSLYDIETMLSIEKELSKIKPGILLYGEPWIGGTSVLPYEKRFRKGKQNQGKISLFNDEFRNVIKGNNDGIEPGYVGSNNFKKNRFFSGCLGSIPYDNSIIGFASKASESINYVSSHDNLILMDKISKTFPKASFEEKQNMNALSLTIVLLSFGVPFIQAGTEFLRSKYGHHNSYNAGNYFNFIDWSHKKDFKHVFDYIKNLISFRKSQKVFSLSDPTDIRKVVKIVDTDHEVISYEINSMFKEDYKGILITYNGSMQEKEVKLLNSKYKIYLDGALYYKEESKIDNELLKIPKLSSVVCIYI